MIWSIEKGQGGKVDILTAGGDAGRSQSQDQGERYTSLADKSLHISRAVVSDSGRYFCNGQLVVQLSVIPSGNIKLYQSCSAVTLFVPLHSECCTVRTEANIKNGFKIWSFESAVLYCCDFFLS